MASAENKKTIFLWSVPRSLSTAVLRAMSTVQGHLGVHEPYLECYYANSDKKLPGIKAVLVKTDYEQVKRELTRELTDHDLLFIKEMPKHLAGKLEDLSYIPEGATHTFLIRHPVKTMTSTLKTIEKVFKDLAPDEETVTRMIEEHITPANISAEQSFKGLVEVHDIVTKVYKQKSIIIDADDLQRNPEGTLRAYCKEVGIEYQDSMVNWGEISEKQITEIWPHFNNIKGSKCFLEKSVLGTRLEQREPSLANVEEVPENFRDLVRENISLYESLRKLKLTPVSV